MIQVTPQMRILVAVEPADFHKGIDGLARLCTEALKRDPFGGGVFVFRNRRATAVKIPVYLGYTQPVGEHLKYLISADGVPVACMAWSSAPRHWGRRSRCATPCRGICPRN